MKHCQALMEHYQANGITLQLDSGKIFKVTRTHPIPQEVAIEDHLSSVDAVQGQHCRTLPRSVVMVTSVADTLADCQQEKSSSKSGKARGLPSASRRAHSRPQMKKRKISSSTILAVRRKRQTDRDRRTAIASGFDPDSDPEDNIPDELEGFETETQMMRIADVHRLYYPFAFRSMNQLACKDIGKAWIRIGHPRKQTSHPYNGGKKDGEFGSVRSVAVYGYLGHFTSPDYWPSDEGWQNSSSGVEACRHKEPDHVLKPGQFVCGLVLIPALTSHLERLVLLVHLLRSQNRGYEDGDFSLEKLMKSTDGIHLEYEENWTPKSLERLENIYWVRKKEMEYERGEMGGFHSSQRSSSRFANTALDANTLVPVLMPKARCKGRKASKSAVKATSPPSDQVKMELGETRVMKCNAPVANMGINVHGKEEDMTLDEGSEPTIPPDTSESPESPESVAPDASCPEPISCESRTIQHGLPFYDSPSPMRHNSSIQESWTPQSTDLGQDPAIFTHPSFFGSVATPSGARISLPLQEQYRCGPSSMSFPGQEFVRGQYDHESTIANGMGPDGTFTRDLPARPVAPKVENIRYPTFASSSTGLAGAFDYSSWQNDDPWHTQAEPSMYTADADPGGSLLPSTYGSFSSGYSDATFSSQGWR